MEIDFSGLKVWRNPVLMIGVLVVLVLLGALGKSYTAASASGAPLVLAWSEWRILKIERQYQEEINHMQQDADLLAGLLAQAPDPVRAQVIAERIERDYTDGLPASAQPRAVLILAAQAVRDWATGTTDVETAWFYLQAAIEALSSESDAETGVRGYTQTKDNQESTTLLPFVIKK